jgi:hypothetical protein
MTTLFTKEELLYFNSALLGRGAPVTDDGMGYNKGDFGACSTYYYGLSDAQYADLAKRLVKYCNTQLKIDQETMKETAKHLKEIAGEADRSDGISLEITEEGTLISFRFNEMFISAIKSLPISKRKFDSDKREWIVNNDSVIKVLKELQKVGADVTNALEYAQNSELIQSAGDGRIEILTKFEEDLVYLKFDYNKEVVETIKEIDKQYREYNPTYKYWRVAKEQWENLKSSLSNVAKFKQF